jgi:hypothetical protein
MAVGKREEMARDFRSTCASGKASRSMNEGSFMKRIVLSPFIGCVLLHMVATNAFFKPNLYDSVLLACTPIERRLITVPAIRPKIGRPN